MKSKTIKVNYLARVEGEGALHILVRGRDYTWLSFMLSRGARPDLQSNDGTTPLGLSAQLGWREGAELLLGRGADVNLANNRGETPLILAVQRRDLPMVRLLLGQRADPDAAHHRPRRLVTPLGERLPSRLVGRVLRRGGAGRLVLSRARRSDGPGPWYPGSRSRIILADDPKLTRAADSPQRRRACIVLWMAGGMAAPDTFDPKWYQPYRKGLKVADMLSTVENSVARMQRLMEQMRSGSRGATRCTIR